MSSIFEFIPTESTTQPVTPSEFIAALPPFVRVNFSDATEEHWSDFEVEITHQEMRKRYPEPMEFYLDAAVHRIATRVSSGGFTSDQSAIFEHVLGLVARALKSDIYSESTDEVEPPENFLNPSIQEDFTAKVTSAEELQRGVDLLAGVMKRVG